MSPDTFALLNHLAHVIHDRLIQRPIQLIELTVDLIQLLHLCRGKTGRVLTIDQAVMALYESGPSRFLRLSTIAHPNHLQFSAPTIPLSQLTAF